jgi:hypothetical protein
MSPDRKTHNQTDRILVGKDIRMSNHDTDNYIVVAKVRERLAVNKPRSHRFHMERFNLKKLNKVEAKEKYHVEVSNNIPAYN